MIQITKVLLLVSSFTLAVSMAACSSGVVPSSSSVNVSSNLVTRISENVTQSKQDLNHYYIDAGKGHITDASLTVKLNLDSGGFKTKSSDGTPAKIASEVVTIDVALIDSALSPVAMGAPVAVGHLPRTFAGGVAAVNGTPGTVGTGAIASSIITFSNLPVSTNKYWVAAAALDVVPANITNVTGAAFSAVATTTVGGSTITAGSYYVSSTGGLAGNGSMAVTKSVVSGKAVYHVDSPTDLGVLLTLADTSVGANITSAVTVNDGTTVAVSGPIVVN